VTQHPAAFAGTRSFETLVFSTLNGVKAVPFVPEPENPTLGARLIPAEAV
jgi:hypothetical protein